MKAGLFALMLVLFGLFAGQATQTFQLKEKSSSFVLTRDAYPRTDFEVEVECTYTQDGKILDTVGINAAPQGSWAVWIAAKQVFIGIWDGAKWNHLGSNARVEPGQPFLFKFVRRGNDLQLHLAGRLDAQLSLAVPLSGQPVFVGDFKGDENWGASYNIHQSMIGTVKVNYFGPPRATASGVRVSDVSSHLTSEETAALLDRIGELEKSERIAISFTFAGAMAIEDRAKLAVAAFKDLYAATSKPSMAIVIADSGVTVHYSNSLLESIGKERVSTSIAGQPKAGRRAAAANAILDVLFGGSTGEKPTADLRKPKPRRTVSGDATPVPPGKDVVIQVGAGTITIPAQNELLSVITKPESVGDMKAPGLRLLGPVMVLQWEGPVDPHSFTPVVTFPPTAISGTQGVNIVRIGDALVDGELSGDEITVLPTLRTKDGGVMAVDTFTPPSPERVVASLSPDKPSFTTRYGLASYTSGLNWKNDPDLVRMVPSTDANERQPFYKLSDAEAAKLKRNPIKNVIVLVHGHNEFEKGGYALGDAPQPWVVQYKRDVWTLFWKQFKQQAKEYVDTTAIYEFVYPSYRPTFQGEMGVDPLGLSLAKAIANDFDIAYAADKDLRFNLYIVAHSMGGLVARAGINRFGDATLRNTGSRATVLENWLEKVVTWGSPHHGSPLVTMRYLLTGGYDIQGSAGVLPISLLKQSNAFNVGVNYFAAMDTPGERALKWDNYRPLNLGKGGWVVPKRTIWETGDMEAYDTTFSLDKGSWLYNSPLSDFNKSDRMRAKVVPFYGVTHKELAAKGSVWTSSTYETLTGRYSDFSRLINSPQIAQGAYLMKWLYQSDQSVGAHPANASDGAVPIESMSGAGLFPRSYFLGDIDHEEYYGAPADGKWTAESLALDTSAATLRELGFDGDKKGKNYPPSVELKQPLPQAPPVGGQSAFSVIGQLTWNGDDKPGNRVATAQLVALNPSGEDLKGRVIPCNLTVSASGAVSGTVLAKDLPAATDRDKPVLRVIFKDKKELDSKATSGPDDITPALQKTTQFMISLFGVVKESSEPALLETQGQLGAGSIGYGGNLVATIIQACKVVGKTVTPPTLQWSGSSFSMALDTGSLDSTSKTRQGTTISKVSHKFSLTGRYDAASRSIKDLLYTSESVTASDFTPDPNWKPRDRLEAEILGPPKASSTRSTTVQKMSLDSVPLAGPPAQDQGGYSLSVSFILDGKVLRPGCVGFYQIDNLIKGAPPSTNMRKIVVGPQTKGVAFQPSGVYVHFILPKP